MQFHVCNPRVASTLSSWLGLELLPRMWGITTRNSGENVFLSHKFLGFPCGGRRKEARGLPATAQTKTLSMTHRLTPCAFGPKTRFRGSAAFRLSFREPDLSSPVNVIRSKGEIWGENPWTMFITSFFV